MFGGQDILSSVLRWDVELWIWMWMPVGEDERGSAVDATCMLSAEEKVASLILPRALPYVRYNLYSIITSIFIAHRLCHLFPEPAGHDRHYHTNYRCYISVVCHLGGGACGHFSNITSSPVKVIVTIPRG